MAKVTENAKGLIKTNIGVIEAGYKINKKHSVRAEAQALFVARDEKGEINDNGNWATFVIEYNVSPNWFFSVMDQYNYGNPDEDLQVHYVYASAGYIHDATRVTVGYGRQRAGFVLRGRCFVVFVSSIQWLDNVNYAQFLKLVKMKKLLFFLLRWEH